MPGFDRISMHHKAWLAARHLQHTDFDHITEQPVFSMARQANSDVNHFTGQRAVVHIIFKILHQERETNCDIQG